MVRAAFLMTLSLAVPASARESGPAQLDAMLRGRVAGPPVQCIDPHWMQSTRIIEGVGIVYDAGRLLYVNRVQGHPEHLRWDDVLVSRVEGGQLCRIDPIRILDPVTRMERGFVVLGDFVPYRRIR
ncbi:MAG: hypothetical protein ACRYFW_01915 [Janthinobacterium lividum]